MERDDMYWQEDQQDDVQHQVPADIVDLSFKVSCKALPSDHAHDLWTAVRQALPWFDNEPAAGLHLIHGAESGNGWLRPEGPDELLYLSRRTRMTLRLPGARIESAEALSGQTLDVGGHELRLGEARVHELSSLKTLFARYVVSEDSEEEAFLNNCARELGEMGIRVKKMMAGRVHRLRFPETVINTRSLMIDGVRIEESVEIQRRGLGLGRKFGCGLFLPHKGIDSVRSAK